VKRDMDLVRKILTAMEAAPLNGPDEFSLDGYDEDAVNYHLAIMGEADLLVILDQSTHLKIEYMPVRLTWSGHEFLEAVRDDSRWNAVKAQMDKAGGFVFDVAKALAISWMSQQLHLP
jgi:hypothetical protein